MTTDEKICPRCAETIKVKAVICRYCGHEFEDARQENADVKNSPSEALPHNEGNPDGQLAEVPNQGMLPVILILGGLLLIAFFVMLWANRDVSRESTAEDAAERAMQAADEAANAADQAALAAVSEQEQRTNWAYSNEVDEVRGKQINYAQVDSANSVLFDFPYSGGSTLRMTIRKHPQYGQDVIVQISDGQFVCGIYDCAGTINFGKGPERVSLNPPGDHDSKTLFIQGAGNVIAKLKTSEKVIIELPFYQEGNRQFTFDTRDLQWPPKAETKQTGTP